MAKRPRSTLALSSEQARQALAVLIHDGKVAASEAPRALKRHRHLVGDLGPRLAALGVLLALMFGVQACATATPAGEKVRVTRNPQATVGCKYLGTVRQYSDSEAALKNKAALLGADTLFTTSQIINWSKPAEGEAYLCGTPPVAR